MAGASIRIFLVSGSPDGLKIVRKSNWTGVIAVVPRSTYPEVRMRGEFDAPCVYVLSGPAESDDVLPRVYVGEADQARKRLDAHIRAKDFWTEAIVVTASDDALHKATARHLEARLIQLALTARRAELDNGNAPQLPPLAEADQADAETFLAEILSILPILRVDAFELPTQDVSPSLELLLSGPDAVARGQPTPEGFLVYTGSVARTSTVPSVHGFLVRLRETLLERGILVPSDGGLHLMQDYAFNSPSTAAGVFLGRAANGRTEWKDAQGRTLKELEEAQLGSP
jgi:hypothetical protein